MIKRALACVIAVILLATVVYAVEPMSIQQFLRTRPAITGDDQTRVVAFRGNTTVQFAYSSVRGATGETGPQGPAGPAGGGATIDDTKGNGDTTYVWSADKSYDQLALKAALISPALTTPTANNLGITGAGGAGYVDLLAQSSNPSAPSAGTTRLHSATTNGFTRLEQDNEAATNLVLGRDSVFIAKNTSGSTINANQPVYVTGSTGNIPNIGLARSNALATLPAIGIALDAISNNAYGQVMKSGVISSVNTSTYSTGDTLWVSPTTAGALVNTRPAYPNFVQRIGSVLVSGIGNGSILVTTAPFVGGMESGTNAATFTATAFVGDGSQLTGIAGGGGADATIYQADRITLPAASTEQTFITGTGNIVAHDLGGWGHGSQSHSMSIVKSTFGNHTGVIHIGAGVEYRPQGSGMRGINDGIYNSPMSMDVGMTVGAEKQNWQRTSAPLPVEGEVNGMYIVQRNGGSQSDGAGMLMDVATNDLGDGTAGKRYNFNALFEGISRLFSGVTQVKSQNVQFGIYNKYQHNGIGMAITALTGVHNDGVYVQSTDINNKWTNGIRFYKEMVNGLNTSEGIFSGDAILLGATQTIGNGTNSYTLAQLAAAAGTDDQTAAEVSVSTTNFGGLLANTASYDTVQEVLDAVDNLSGLPAAPSGSDTQLQYNDAGTTAGATGLLWDKTNSVFTANSRVAVAAGTIASGQNVYSLTGTLPASPAATVIGISTTITSAGSANFRQYGHNFTLGAGYTGSYGTAAYQITNSTAGTGTEPFHSTQFGNMGFRSFANGTTTGTNTAAYASASGGNINISSLSVVGGSKADSTNVGSLNISSSSGTNAINVGGFFGTTSNAALPTLVSSALIADNGTFAYPIFIARDNGTTKFQIYDDGGMAALSKEVVKTASATLEALEVSGTVITNYGETDDANLVLTLPDLDTTPGANFIGKVSTAMSTYDVCFKAAADNAFVLDGTAGADNGCICNATPTLRDKLACVATTSAAGAVEIDCETTRGTWALVADNTGSCPN
jgi:hypothetical protein